MFGPDVDARGISDDLADGIFKWVQADDLGALLKFRPDAGCRIEVTRSHERVDQLADEVGDALARHLC